MYEVNIEFGTQIFAAGAFDQTPAVATNNDNYDLNDNSFFKDSLLHGYEIKLNHMPGYGRFKDELYKDMVHIVDKGTLPEHLTNQIATEDHDFHVTVTRQKNETNWQRYVASDTSSK